ncbi:MAG: hypothetical protein JW862_07080 [Anaerolineales bacterium]|nr:hypothetical protein [Anaerolineales bacterium]
MPSRIHQTRQNLARRWLRAWALLLILAWLPIPAAQAAPAVKPPQKRTYDFSLTASVNAGREGLPVCAGDTVSFFVHAWRSAVDSIDSHKDIARQPAFGVKIDALSLQKDILQVQGSASLWSSLDVERPGGAEFTFKARKEGRAVIVFEALFPTRLVDQETRQGLSQDDLNATLFAQVSKTVDVIECPLELTVMNQYYTQKLGVMQQFIGLISNARLQKSGQDDTLFVYEGLETVVLTEKLPECTVTWQKNEREVTIEARRLDKHYHITIRRGPMVMEVTHQCENGQNTTNFVVPDGGEQEWDVPLKGGAFDRSMRSPMASFWWVIQARARKP